MNKPEKNIIPVSPETAVLIISLLILVPLLLAGFLSH